MMRTEHVLNSFFIQTHIFIKAITIFIEMSQVNISQFLENILCSTALYLLANYAPQLCLELSCLSFMYLISVTTGYRGTSLGLFLPRFRTFINSDSSIKSLLTRPPRESFQTNTKINSTIWPYQCHVAFKSKNIKSPEYWQCTQIYFMRLPNDIVDIYLLPGWYRSNLSRIHRNYLDP